MWNAVVFSIANSMLQRGYIKSDENTGLTKNYYPTISNMLDKSLTLVVQFLWPKITLRIRGKGRGEFGSRRETRYPNWGASISF